MLLAHARAAICSLAAAILLAGAQPANATVITTGCANVNVGCSLLELLTGGTIQTNELVFSAFTPINVLGFGYAQYPNIANVYVYGLDDGGLDPGPGLLFDLNGQWDVTGQGLIDFETTFNVATVGNQIKDSSVILDPSTSASGAGSESGVEDYLFEFAGGPAIYRLVADLRPSEGFNVMSVQTQFAPRDAVHGVLSFRVNGGGTGSAFLDQFILRFSQTDGDTQPPSPVPEPGTLTLMGSLIALAITRGRRRGSATGNRTRA